MHTHVLGVTETWDGKASSAVTLNVRPDDGRGALPYVSGTTFTSVGRVVVDWQPSKGVLQTTLPGATTTVSRPASCKGSLAVTSKPAGGKVVQATSSAATVAGAGEWAFSC